MLLFYINAEFIFNNPYGILVDLRLGFGSCRIKIKLIGVEPLAERGNDYYLQNRVVYIEIDGTKGRAIVEGSKPYTVEFNYKNGEVTNLTCDCFCAGHCKHEFATLLQLRETLNIAEENYDIDGKSDYIAIISKPIFVDFAFGNKQFGTFNMDLQCEV